MIGYTQTNRGSYRCNYCSHKSWKTASGALNHVEQQHPTEIAVERAKDAERQKRLDAERRANNAEGRAIRAEQEAARLRDQCKPKEQARYSAVVYCPNCLSVDSVRIVRGQAIGGGGCFRCGAMGGQLVEHVNVNAGNYKVEE